ncbi:MFS transporter [Actinoplanes sp. RD1]|uniref:MFS transporter n=1 Tax=Actinoplanes sp. RD1 TaxID=3064538 RepID=UPI0027429D16|nr:MFS transporter [Actinoplanes sp. RD1]
MDESNSTPMSLKDVPRHDGEPAPSRYAVAAIPLALLGWSIALVPPLAVTIALRLRELDVNGAAANLGIVLGVGAFFSFVTNPLAGRLSDRTMSRFGMRKPWIFSGAAIGYAGIAVIAFAPNVPVVLLGWSIAQIGLNFCLAALIALLPDQVEPGRRGRVASFISLAQNVGGVGATFLVQLFPIGPLQSLVPSLFGVVLMLAVVAPIKDKVRTERPVDRFDVKTLFGSFVFNPRRHPDLGWAWLTRFFLNTTQFTATSYLTYFLIAEFNISDDEAPTMVFQAVLVNAVGLLLVTPVLGWLSDKLGRRKPFVILSSLIATVGLTVIALSSTIPMLLLGQFILGAGVGAFFAVELALIADVLPSEETAGKDLGVANLAQSLPQSLIPIAAPGVIAAFGYPGLFIGGAIFGILGALGVTRVRKVR